MHTITVISIHAPVKGATCRFCRCLGSQCHFNPRSREGSDMRNSPFTLSQFINFNPRSREGSDSPGRPIR